MSRISAVLFDYGLVLSGPPDPAAWQRMKDLLHAEEDAFHAAYWKWRDAYDRGALTAEAYWREVASTLSQTLDENTVEALIEADLKLWTQPNQPMIDWAAALNRAGIRTGILSNIGDAMETGIVARCSWINAFHHHTFSHRLGMTKPEAAIYEHAAQGLGVAPANILFVDDRAENIAAARAAGMNAVQYSSHEDFLRAMHAGGWDSLL